MEIQHPFYQLLSQLILNRASISSDKYSEIYNELVDLVRHKEVSPTIVVQSVASVFAQASADYYLTIIHHMNTIYFLSRNNGDYLYPEFFWIITQNNAFSKTNNLADIMHLMSNFCDDQVLRAYLSFLLMARESRRYKDIIFSFISVGHTLTTLRLVLDVVPINEENLDLYDYTYTDAMEFLYSPRAATLTADDKTWLQEFFTRGLLLEYKRIPESCQKALKKLAE